MNKYIATFHNHSGALSYYELLKKLGITAKLTPVPRKVSASCGTGVYYEHNAVVDLNNCDLDSVYLDANNTFERMLKKK